MAISIKNNSNYTKVYKLLKGYRECPKCETLTYPETLNLYLNETWKSNVEFKNKSYILTCSNCKYIFDIDLPKPRII